MASEFAAFCKHVRKCKISPCQRSLKRKDFKSNLHVNECVQCLHCGEIFSSFSVAHKHARNLSHPVLLIFEDASIRCLHTQCLKKGMKIKSDYCDKNDDLGVNIDPKLLNGYAHLVDELNAARTRKDNKKCNLTATTTPEDGSTHHEYQSDSDCDDLARVNVNLIDENNEDEIKTPSIVSGQNGHKRSRNHNKKEAEAVESEQISDNARNTVHGLVNLGNTCYLNSVLQVLAKSSELLDCYQAAKRVGGDLYYEGQITDHLLRILIKINGKDTGAMVATKNHNTNRSKHAKAKTKKKKKSNGNWNGGAINPRSLFSAIIEKAPQFADEFEMHDAHELLVVLLNAIEEEELGQNHSGKHVLGREEGIVNKRKQKLKPKKKTGEIEAVTNINVNLKESFVTKILFLGSESDQGIIDKNDLEDGSCSKNYAYWFGSLTSGTLNIGTHSSKTDLGGYATPLLLSLTDSECIASPLDSNEKGALIRSEDPHNFIQENHDEVNKIRKARSIVCKLFSAGIQRRVVCENCGHESQKVDDTCVVSVPLPESKSKTKKKREYGASVSQCIELFSQECFIEGLNCEACTNTKSGVKRGGRLREVITHGPRILCIHFKRFKIKFENGVIIGEKDDTVVELRIREKVNLEDACLDNRKPKDCNSYVEYELFGIISHCGKSLESGHYISFVCGSGNESQWFMTSDDEVKPVSVPSALAAQVYIAFYRRVV